MGLTGNQAYALAKKNTDDSIKGISGTLAGKNCTIKSIVKSDKTSTVTFEWTANDGTTKTDTMTVKDGENIASATVNASNHLILTMTDGSTVDAGEMPQEEVSVSAETGNALVKKTDGLYVSATGVEISAETGNTLITKADGLFVPATDISGKVDKVTGKGLSTNDYDATEKAEVAKIANKVDKVTGKGLSTNDYDNTEKAEVAKVAGKVDKAQGSANAGKILVVGADGNVTLGDDKGSDVVTAWETTPVDTKVPSEKLVKDNLDTMTQELAKKVAIAQGEANKGKALIVGNDGNVTCGTVATDNLTIVDKTQAQYDVLTDAEKNDASKLYNITDADDLDLTSYAKQSDVDAINSNLNWKLVGSATGKTAISLPSVFNELHIVIKWNSGGNTFSFNILKEEISDTSTAYMWGDYYPNYGSSNFITISKSQCSIVRIYLNNSSGDVTDSSSISIYYR